MTHLSEKVIAIDPGSEKSAFVVWNGKQILSKGKHDNQHLLSCLHNPIEGAMVIEQINPYAIGKAVRDTIFWSGRFWEAFTMQFYNKAYFLNRDDVREYLCGKRGSSIKDRHIRQALIDRFGNPGTKKAPNLIYDEDGTQEKKMKADLWSALGLAVTWWDTCSAQ
jgi:hypothetical protein